MCKTIITNRTEYCLATTEMSDGMYFTFTFNYPQRNTIPQDLSERISAEYSQDWSRYRIMAGYTEMMFSRYQSEQFFRLDEIYSYTNVEQWPALELEDPPRDGENCFLAFDNGREELSETSLGCSSEFLIDTNTSRLLLRFRPRSEDESWFQVADTVYALVTPNSHLAAFQFERFSLVPVPSETENQVRCY